MKRWLFLMLLVLGSTAQARIETHVFQSEADEARYQILIEELRCLVCQNQNLADSNAELAQDLRKQIYQMIDQGKSSEAITAFMVERYGDFVLYRPPLNQSTAVLWIGPFIILLLAVFILLRYIRARDQGLHDEINEEELQRAQTLLNSKQGETNL